MKANGIKTMKLYHQVERVLNELAALGVGPDDPIDVEQLSGFDQYHYFGTAAVDEGIQRLGITVEMNVLEVGGGIGGPARHIAHRVGCQIVALELQPDLDETARNLTERCGLSDKVEHICGDILEGAPRAGTYDALVSWLTFLHIPDRETLYRRCFEALKPGGGFYAEDFFARSVLTTAERETLAQHIFCHRSPSMEEYRAELMGAGFVELELTDLSVSWDEYVNERVAGYRASRTRNLELHGAEVVEGLDAFYGAVEKLFRDGNWGGLRMVARKPS